ncbi:hypothetical protein KAN5_22150 [Pseudoalteromonas sp. KAN5]|nr:hypothetical protein KAN5_22150 [Pseudoalteromonas sp. KAN5]
MYVTFKMYEYLKSALSLTIISLFLFLILIAIEPESANPPAFLSDSGRIEMWLNSIPDFENILFGIGSGNYQIRLNSVVLSHPHNFVIQIFVEQGLISLITCFYFLFIITFVFLKNRHKKTTNQEKVAFITFVTAVIYSLFSGLIVMPITQIIFVLIFSQLIECNETTKFNRKLKIIVATITSIYFTLSMISFYKLEPNTPKMAGPSFWSAGEKT